MSSRPYFDFLSRIKPFLLFIYIHCLFQFRSLGDSEYYGKPYRFITPVPFYWVLNEDVIGKIDVI